MRDRQFHGETACHRSLNYSIMGRISRVFIANHTPTTIPQRDKSQYTSAMAHSHTVTTHTITFAHCMWPARRLLTPADDTILYSSWHVCRELPQHVYPPARRLVHGAGTRNPHHSDSAHLQPVDIRRAPVRRSAQLRLGCRDRSIPGRELRRSPRREAEEPLIVLLPAQHHHELRPARYHHRDEQAQKNEQKGESNVDAYTVSW